MNAQDLVREHPVLVAPTLYVASDAQLDALTAYANAGGHLIVGIRTGYGDELARARAAVAPDRILYAAGIWYDEYSTLDEPVSVSGSDLLPLPPSAGGLGWADALQIDDAQTLATFTEGITARPRS